MLCDMSQYIAQPGLGIYVVELGCTEQRVAGGTALAAAVDAGEQIVAAANGDAPQHPLGGPSCRSR